MFPKILVAIAGKVASITGVIIEAARERFLGESNWTS
jgi:hypothetical protein